MTKIIRFDIKPTEEQLCIKYEDNKNKNHIDAIDIKINCEINEILSIDDLWLRHYSIFKAGLLNFYIVDGALKMFLLKYFQKLDYTFEVLCPLGGSGDIDDKTMFHMISSKGFDLNKSSYDTPMVLVFKNPD